MPRIRVKYHEQMAGRKARTRVAMGFRVRTGRAIGLSLALDEPHPNVVVRHDLVLCDPEEPETQQPYHVALELDEARARPVIRRACRLVKSLGVRNLRTLAKELDHAGYELDGIGIVAGSLSDPDRVTNPHIRAHALEGKLFREAIEEGAVKLGLPSVTLVEKTQLDEAARALGRSRESLETALRAMGRAAGRPWRGYERSAAIAGWVRLSMGSKR